MSQTTATKTTLGLRVTVTVPSNSQGVTAQALADAFADDLLGYVMDDLDGENPSLLDGGDVAQDLMRECYDETGVDINVKVDWA